MPVKSLGTMTLFAAQHLKHLQHFHYQFSLSMPKPVSLLLHAITFQLLNAAHTALSSANHSLLQIIMLISPTTTEQFHRYVRSIRMMRRTQAPACAPQYNHSRFCPGAF
jgi:hypothetical protein